jgi:hypothetical protein
VVIDVTRLFEDDVPAISGLSSALRTQFQRAALDGGRSFIDSARSFPQNVEVRHTQTFEAASRPSQARTGTITMQMNQSLVLLPARADARALRRPAGRLVQHRTRSTSGATSRRRRSAVIRRWRLEPSDPAAYARGELVEPVKPIVFYLDPATPHEWRRVHPRGRRGLAARVRGGRLPQRDHRARRADAEEDPDFSPEDVRYSTVRWVANLTRNATGPERLRPALRRDHLQRHHLVPQPPALVPQPADDRDRRREPARALAADRPRTSARRCAR